MKLSLVAALAPALTCAACAGSTPAPRTYTAAADDAPIVGPSVPPVYLHLAASEGATLQRLSTRDADWKDVCAAPCDGYVPAFGNYRVSLPDRGPTDDFTLPGPPGTSVALKADDDGHVWTRDSVDLRSRRARSAATGATWVAIGALMFK